MELQGKVIAALPEKSGVSQRSGTEWKAQDFVIETHESYPHKMVFSVFGSDRLARFNVQVGQEISVSFDIDAHEYQGRWFNSIRAFDVRLVDPATIGQTGAQPMPDPAGFGAAPVTSAAPQTPTQPTTQAAPQAPFPTQSGDSADDLPF